MNSSAARTVRLTDVLRSRVFLALYVAETQSILGDQLARVALSVIVFERTGSTAETALAYALTFLPAIAGGALLSGVSDRFPRRAVMVVCDLVRGGLLAGMSVAGLPTPLLLALLTVVVFLGPAFTSAEVSMIASVLHGERYRAATGLRMITNQLAQAAGFALGGVAIALVGPRWALLVDAFSFLASAAVVAVGATGVVRTARRSRPAPDPLAAGSPPRLRAIFKDQQMRALIGLTWLAGFFVVPEGLAAPYAAAVGGGPGSVGLLMTAIPLGSVIGAGAVLRLLRPRGRLRAVRIMAVATGLPLLGCAAEPGIGPTALLWLVSGVFAAYMIDVMTSVVQIAPEHSRGRLIGLVGAGLTGVQGIGTVVFGVIAEHVGTGRAIAAAGGAGALIAAYLTQSLRRSLGRHVATISVPEVLSTS